MKTPQFNPFRSPHRPLVMGHRGDQTVSPENTLLALKNAALLELDVIETDIRMTKDNELILFHDETLDRTTNKTGPVKNYTLDELNQVDLGYSFTLDSGKSFPARGQNWKVVTLRQAFDLFPKMHFNLDIKNVDPIVPELLAKIIIEYSREDSILVGSFHHFQIKKFRKILPHVHTSASPQEVRRFLTFQTLFLERIITPRYSAFQVPITHQNRTIVTKRFVRAAHAKNIAVHVWVVNDRLSFEYLIQLGVDGIFTDDPWLLLEVLQEKELI